MLYHLGLGPKVWFAFITAMEASYYDLTSMYLSSNKLKPEKRRALCYIISLDLEYDSDCFFLRDAFINDKVYNKLSEDKGTLKFAQLANDWKFALTAIKV
jgi:hypothetical protein